MRLTRIYTGADGEAFLEDLDVEFDSDKPGANSASFPVERLFFRSFPEHHAVDYHVGPRRQWVLVVSGVMEIECKSGARRFLPGAVLFVDDLTGRGHMTRNIKGAWTLAYLPTPPGFDYEALLRSRVRKVAGNDARSTS
ncbi:MAG: hypothetical protein ACKVQU_18755 [Burkholderiales bacterium]